MAIILGVVSLRFGGKRRFADKKRKMEAVGVPGVCLNLNRALFFFFQGVAEEKTLREAVNLACRSNGVNDGAGVSCGGGGFYLNFQTA